MSRWKTETWRVKGEEGAPVAQRICCRVLRVSVIWCACKEDRAYTLTLRSNGPDDGGKRDRFLPSFPAFPGLVYRVSILGVSRLLRSPVRLQLIRFFIQGCRAPASVGGLLVFCFLLLCLMGSTFNIAFV